MHRHRSLREWSARQQSGRLWQKVFGGWVNIAYHTPVWGIMMCSYIGKTLRSWPAKFHHRILISWDIYHFCIEPTLRKTSLPEVHWQRFHACAAGICNLQYVCTRNGMLALLPWKVTLTICHRSYINHILCKWGLAGRPEGPDQEAQKVWSSVHSLAKAGNAVSHRPQVGLSVHSFLGMQPCFIAQG